MSDTRHEARRLTKRVADVAERELTQQKAHPPDCRCSACCFALETIERAVAACVAQALEQTGCLASPTQHLLAAFKAISAGEGER